jgi:putative ABC transport system permease protein
MDPRELLRLALAALKAHTLRSFLTLLGVIIGVTTIVAVVGAISGTNQYVQDSVNSLAPDVYVVTRFGIITSQKDFLQALKRQPLTFQDYQRLRSAGLQHMADICAQSRAFAELKAGAKVYRNGRAQGRTANAFEIMPSVLAAGRVFTESEDASAAHVAVIGADIREALFGAWDPIGREILVGGVPFRVVGVLNKQGRSIGPNQDNAVSMPMEVYRKTFMSPRGSMDFIVKAGGGPEGVTTSQDEVRTLMRALRHTAFRDPDPFGVVSQDLIMDLWNKLTGAAFAVMVLISGISLTVGGVVIMNIMLVSVAERTAEIGVRRAMGARRRDIWRQFLLEAALLSATGGLVGIILGGSIIGLLRLTTSFPAQLTPLIVGLSLLVATLVGVLAGFLPARRAAGLLVIDAIRAE